MTAVGDPLRVGLLLDDTEIPWWVAPALQTALERDLITIPFAAIRATPPEPVSGSRVARWWRNRSYLGLGAYQRLDAWIHRALKPPPSTSVAALAPAAEVLVITPQETRFSDYFLSEDVALIRKLNPDLLLRIGFRIVRGDILTAAPAGVWSFHHGDSRVNRGGPACLWEVLLDWPTTGLTLQRLTEELDGGVVLDRAVIATRHHSWHRNTLAVYQKSPAMLLRAIARLRHQGNRMSPPDPQRVWDHYDGPLFRTPTNRDLFTHLPRLACRRYQRRAGAGSRAWQWSIGWMHSGEGNVPHGTMHRYRELKPPPDRYWADPFPVASEGRHWIFFEQVLNRSPKGTICVLEMGPKGPLGDPLEVLTEPFHLSFPNVFEIEGTWYMMPETAQAHEVRVYRAVRFPDQWTFHGSLEGASGADPALVHHDGLWYLFTSEGSPEFGRSEELNLFVASAPFGPYRAHPANPVAADVRCARMAGRVFADEGRLYRPAQIATPHYGAGIAIMEVTDLTAETYREERLGELRPTWRTGLAGLHTLNAAGGMSTIDLLRRA